jgi:hypothetical protein
LGQEIGEECGERYGRVERIVVDVEGARVFIRFVEGVSALRVSFSLFFSFFLFELFVFPLPSCRGRPSHPFLFNQLVVHRTKPPPWLTN